jgi:excisionase family DNA binding protein
MSDAASTVTAYNIAQVMDRLGICRDAVYKAIKSGQLSARKYGKRTLILERDLEAFLESLPKARDMVSPIKRRPAKDEHASA